MPRDSTAPEPPPDSGGAGFSVVIPVHDRAEMVAAAVESVLLQDPPPREVLVVDDGSTDGTPERLRGFGNRIRVLRQDNAGPGAARNRGAAAASGEYLAFLDSDDRWYPWTLRTYRRILRERRNPAVVAGCLYPLGPVDPPPPPGDAPPEVLAFEDYLDSGEEWRWRGASSFVIRRDAFLDAGGFLEGPVNAEDADLMLRLGTAPGFVQVLRPATFGYRVHQGSLYGDIARTAAGSRHLVETERRGGYPGGRARAWERRTVIGRHVRPVTLELLRKGRSSEAWWFYRAMLPWNLRQARLRYLAAFPAIAAARAVGRGGVA